MVERHFGITILIFFQNKLQDTFGLWITKGGWLTTKVIFDRLYTRPTQAGPAWFYKSSFENIKMPRKGEDDSVSLPMVQEMLEQLKTYFKELLDQQEKSFKSCVQVIVDCGLCVRMDNLFKDVQSVTKDIQDLKTSLQFSQAEVDEIKAKSSKMAEKHQAIAESFGEYQASLNSLTGKLDYMDNISRKKNIVIDGVPDVKSETWIETEAKVKKLFLEHLKIEPKHIEFERGLRIGKYDSTGRPRSILIELLRYKDKQEILKRAKFLKGTNIYINEDYSDKVRTK